MKVGYVRISSKEQNTARQDELMKNLGVEKVFTDKMSGKNTDRPELTKMMEFVRQGDTLIVESISRFARNTKDLLELIEQLEEKQVQFVSQKEALDTNTPTGKFMLTIFGAVAELERQYIKERQREGIDIAMAEGRFNGRPKKKLDIFDEVYTEWKNNKITATKASKQLSIARSTFYRRVKEYEDNIVIDF
ncbi:recombinase family protein [Clostridium autoethanogenum]|uniref:Recombinase family protein n=1 Tax=Clostridium autoethanogenum TaxID=84023 RepID=A0A3M0SJC9_9CLOT|nr:recombinase family protein [Clostridium autoethanogenum]RMC97784.1 recombinase family protein [Clostridium autoethanogenum]